MLSFTTILLILFIIIGVYLIFTNRVEGRPKIIIIIAIIICLIFIIMNMSVFKKSTSSPIDASIITYVPPINASIPLIGTPIPLIDTTSPTFSLSTWINITDWNPGVQKTVFSMTNSIIDNYTPKIELGLHKNELIITYYTKPSSQNYSLETIIIPQIRIQKWIHIAISFGENSVDTYLDGKLVDSHVNTDNIQHVTIVPNDTRLNWGGFIGYISSYNYLPNFLTPQEVLALYIKGV